MERDHREEDAHAERPKSGRSEEGASSFPPPGGEEGPFVEVDAAANLPDAYLAKAALEAAGIPVRVENEFLQGALGELPPSLPTYPRILVPETLAGEACRLLEQARQAQRSRQQAGEDLEDEEDEGEEEPEETGGAENGMEPVSLLRLAGRGLALLFRRRTGIALLAALLLYALYRGCTHLLYGSDPPPLLW